MIAALIIAGLLLNFFACTIYVRRKTRDFIRYDNWKIENLNDCYLRLEDKYLSMDERLDVAKNTFSAIEKNLYAQEKRLSKHESDINGLKFGERTHREDLVFIRKDMAKLAAASKKKQQKKRANNTADYSTILTPHLTEFFKKIFPDKP